MVGKVAASQHMLNGNALTQNEGKMYATQGCIWVDNVYCKHVHCLCMCEQANLFAVVLSLLGFCSWFYSIRLFVLWCAILYSVTPDSGRCASHGILPNAVSQAVTVERNGRSWRSFARVIGTRDDSYEISRCSFLWPFVTYGVAVRPMFAKKLEWASCKAGKLKWPFMTFSGWSAKTVNSNFI